MTGHQINSLVGDLVAMAQAMEQLPKVERELEQVRNELGTKVDTIQRLELKLLDRANEIDKLHVSIRELEVAKDQAETMFLEADDRTTRALEFVKTMFGSAGSLIQALEPVKAVEPVSVQVDPIVNGTSTETPSLAAGQVDESGLSEKPQGQSEPGPTTAVPFGEKEDSVNSSAMTQDVISEKTDALSPDKPYAGRAYSEVNREGSYPNHDEWIAGGGDERGWWM